MQINTTSTLVRNNIIKHLESVAAKALLETAQGDVVKKCLQDKFKSNQGTWAKLAASTVIDRVNHGYGGAKPILIRSRHLVDNLITYYRITNNGLTVTIGNGDVVAVVLNNGSPKNNLPARPFFYLDKKDTKKISKTVAKALKALWTKS